MNVHGLCCIGYITQDRIVTTKNTVYMPGGTSFYFAHAIKHLDPSGFLLITTLADTEMNVVEDVRKEGIEVKTLPSVCSVCFENIYGENQNERTQCVTAKADPFTMKGLQNVSARIIHLDSLLTDNLSLSVIKYLSSKGVLLVDIQGFLCKVDNERVLPMGWTEKKETLKHIHILKANETEMEVLTGCKDPREAALLIADWGVKEALLTLGDKDSLIYAKGQFHEVPACSALQIVDAMGCGDIYMVGYLCMHNRDVSYQGVDCFAAAMYTIKLQTHGLFYGTEAEIRRIITPA